MWGLMMVGLVGWVVGWLVLYGGSEGMMTVP